MGGLKHQMEKRSMDYYYFCWTGRNDPTKRHRAEEKTIEKGLRTPYIP